MKRSGYDVQLSAGAITAGGTLGILIPPSVMLIVMGPVVGIPATDLFAAAVIPGLLLSTIFTVWCLVRCWLNPALGYLFTHRARVKARQWFSARALEETLAEGRAILNRELQRMGETSFKLDDLASRLGFSKIDDLLAALARAEISPRQLQAVVRGNEANAQEREVADEATVRKQKSNSASDKGILIVGVDKLLTQLAGCCKPAPPDPIVGFVTRGKGVSIHRADCSNFSNMEAMHPERVIETEWGTETDGVFAVDIAVDAQDRQGLLRDVSEVLTREKINVIAVNTQSRQGMAHMSFTAEIGNVGQLKRTLNLLQEVNGVTSARRA